MLEGPKPQNRLWTVAGLGCAGAGGIGAARGGGAAGTGAVTRFATIGKTLRDFKSVRCLDPFVFPFDPTTFFCLPPNCPAAATPNDGGVEMPLEADAMAPVDVGTGGTVLEALDFLFPLEVASAAVAPFFPRPFLVVDALLPRFFFLTGS